MSRAASACRPPRHTPGPTAAEAGDGDPASWTDRKRCRGCGRVKPLEQFWADRRSRDGRRPRCKRCASIDNAERWRTGAAREWYAEYCRREDVRRSRLEAVKRYQRRHADGVAAYGKSVRRRLLDSRWKARRRLGAAENEAGRARALALIAACDRELARMDAERDGD